MAPYYLNDGVNIDKYLQIYTSNHYNQMHISVNTSNLWKLHMRTDNIIALRKGLTPTRCHIHMILFTDAPMYNQPSVFPAPNISAARDMREPCTWTFSKKIKNNLFGQRYCYLLIRISTVYIFRWKQKQQAIKVYEVRSMPFEVQVLNETPEPSATSDQ